MLTLNDGRKDIYQWDDGRTAKVSVDCNAVHFSNLKYGDALPMEVIDGVVKIPNQLLTSGMDLYCYAFVEDENGFYTKKEQTISVIKRPKPTDYVYNETEFMNVEKAVDIAIKKVFESGEIVDDVIEQMPKTVIAGSAKNSLIGNDIGTNDAHGNNATAFGTNTTAGGAGAFSANSKTKAIGDISTAFGEETIASTTRAFVSGHLSQANGISSFAANYNNKTYGKYSFIAGNGNIVGSANPVRDADGESSSAFGVGNEVTGRYSNSFGAVNKVSGKYSNSFGVANEVSGNYSNSQGYNQKNKGHFASTFGTGTETYELSENQAAFGKFNNAESDSLFMIGNGTSDTKRKNAFEVKQNGSIHLGKNCQIDQFGNLNIAPDHTIRLGNDDQYATRVSNNSLQVGKTFQVSNGTIKLGNNLSINPNGSIMVGAAELTEAKVNAINLAGLPLHVIKYGDHKGMNKLSQFLPYSGTGEVTAVCCYDTGNGVICAPLSFYLNGIDYHFTGVVFREKEYQIVRLRYNMVSGTWSVEFKPILSNSGMVITSPNGTKFNVTVDDSGNLSSVQA